ncbi:unnamed protein product, partial [marine sediment metagenome]
PITVKFNGKGYKLRQITTQDYGEIVRYLKTLYIGEVGKSLRLAGVKEDKIIAEVRKLQFEEWGVKGENKKEIAAYYNKKVRPLMTSNEAVSYLLYLGLRKEHSELTLEDTGNIVAGDPGGMDKLVTYVMGGITERRKKAKNV